MASPNSCTCEEIQDDLALHEHDILYVLEMCCAPQEPPNSVVLRVIIEVKVRQTDGGGLLLDLSIAPDHYMAAPNVRVRTPLDRPRPVSCETTSTELQMLKSW